MFQSAQKVAEQKSDTQLMAQVVAQDAAAFHQLVQRYGVVIHRAAMKYTADHAQAEDVAQQVMINWWQRAEKWDGEKGKLLTWLLTLTHNAAMDAHRKNKRHVPIEDDALAQVAQEQNQDAPLMEQIEQRQLACTVLAWVDDLPEKQRQAVWLTYFAGWPNSMTAEHLGISVKAVESLLVRARKILKEKAEKGGMGYDAKN